MHRTTPVGDGARHDDDRGPRPRSRLADASYQGYGAYATLDGSRVDTREYADLDWPGPRFDPDEFDSAGCDLRRPDAAIHAELRTLLLDNPHVDASAVELVVARGKVLLIGLVASREVKRLIEDIAYRVDGVLDVDNLLRLKL